MVKRRRRGLAEEPQKEEEEAEGAWIGRGCGKRIGKGEREEGRTKQRTFRSLYSELELFLRLHLPLWWREELALFSNNLKVQSSIMFLLAEVGENTYCFDTKGL